MRHRDVLALGKRAPYFPRDTVRLGPSHEAVVLDALRAAGGRFLTKRELADAIYPAGAERPASALDRPTAVVSRLRERGIPVVFVAGRGYRLGSAP